MGGPGYPHHELSNTEVERRLVQRGYDPTRARLMAWLRDKQPTVDAEVARALDR